MKCCTTEYELISIILPVYNGEKYINSCLEYIFQQTYPNIEIVIVNDGSTDNTKKIVEKYALDYPNIVLINQQNQGQWKARNVGLDNAHGDYIGFVDVDDYIRPEMFEVLYELAKKHQADIASCDRYRNINYKNDFENMKTDIDDELVFDGKKAVIHLFSDTSVIKPALWDKLYKRKLFDGIRCENTFYEDMSITYKLLYLSKKVIVSRKQLYGYSVHDGSLITSDWTAKKTKSYYDVMEQIVDYFKDVTDNELQSSINFLRMQWGIESWGYMWNSTKINDAEKREFIRYIRDNNGKIKWKFVKLAKTTKCKKKVEFLLFSSLPYFFIRLKKMLDRCRML